MPGPTKSNSAPSSSSKQAEELASGVVVAALAVLAGAGFVAAFLMGYTAQGLQWNPAVANGNLALLWRVSPTPFAMYFDATYVLVVAAIGQWMWLAFQSWKANRQRPDPRLITGQKFTPASLLGEAGVLVLLAALVAVGAMAWVTGTIEGGVILGLALAAPWLYKLADATSSRFELPAEQWLLGRSKGKIMVAPQNQGLMIVAGPRSGKTSGVIIPNILSASWASVVSTSTRSDIFYATYKARLRVGEVFVFDPMHLLPEIPEGVKRLNWSPASGCKDFSVALRHAEEFTRGLDDGVQNGGFFSKAANRLLAATFAVIAKEGLPLREIPVLLNEDSLEQLVSYAKGDKYLESVVTSLVHSRELKSIQTTASTAISIFDTNYVATPEPSDVPLRALSFLNGTNTLYIIAKSDLSGSVSLGPFTTALLTDLHSAIHKVSQGNRDGKLTVPHLWVLDETYALGGIAALPKMASESSGRKHHICIVLQSAEQLQALYGRDADSIWDLFGTQMAGSGIKSVPTLQRLEAVAGGQAAERARENERSKKLIGDRLVSHEIAQLREGEWLVISQSSNETLHPTLIKGLPYWKTEPWATLSETGEEPRHFSVTRAFKERFYTPQIVEDEEAEEPGEEDNKGDLASTDGHGFGHIVRQITKKGSTQLVGCVESSEDGIQLLHKLRKGRGNARRVASPVVEVEHDESAFAKPVVMRPQQSVSMPRYVEVPLPDDDFVFSENEVPATTVGPRINTQPSGSKPNQHSGKCELCGQRVLPGEGWRYRPNANSVWIVRHMVCPTENQTPTPLTSGAKINSATNPKSATSEFSPSSKATEPQRPDTPPQTPPARVMVLPPPKVRTTQAIADGPKTPDRTPRLPLGAERAMLLPGEHEEFPHPTFGMFRRAVPNTAGIQPNELPGICHRCGQEVYLGQGWVYRPYGELHPLFAHQVCPAYEVSSAPINVICSVCEGRYTPKEALKTKSGKHICKYCYKDLKSRLQSSKPRPAVNQEAKRA